MIGTITFKVGEVRRLYEHSRTALEHSPSFEHLFDAAFHKGGVVLCKDGKAYKESSKEVMWPDGENIDTKLIPACLVLVGDQGIYLMSNGCPAQLVNESGHGRVVAYCKESDPTSSACFDDWYEAKNRIFGGDDGTVPLPLSMFEQVMKLPDDKTFKVKLTMNHVSVLAPSAPAKPVRLTYGMVLKFKKPFVLKNGQEASLFRIESTATHIVMALGDNGEPLGQYKISNMSKYVRNGAAEVVPPAK